MPVTATSGEGTIGLVLSNHARFESENSRSLGLSGSNRGLGIEKIWISISDTRSSSEDSVSENEGAPMEGSRVSGN